MASGAALALPAGNWGKARESRNYRCAPPNRWPRSRLQAEAQRAGARAGDDPRPGYHWGKARPQDDSKALRQRGRSCEGAKLWETGCQGKHEQSPCAERNKRFGERLLGLPISVYVASARPMWHSYVTLAVNNDADPSRVPPSASRHAAAWKRGQKRELQGAFHTCAIFFRQECTPLHVCSLFCVRRSMCQPQPLGCWAKICQPPHHSLSHVELIDAMHRRRELGSNENNTCGKDSSAFDERNSPKVPAV